MAPLPVAVLIAAQRHGLADVDVVISRSLVYLGLSGLVVVMYVVLVWLVGDLLDGVVEGDGQHPSLRPRSWPWPSCLSAMSCSAGSTGSCTATPKSPTPFWTGSVTGSPPSPPPPRSPRTCSRPSPSRSTGR